MPEFIRFTNIKAFEADLEAFADKIDVRLDQVIAKIAFDLFSGFSLRTPVDTGYARANWLISFGNIDQKTLKPGSITSEAAAVSRNNRQLAKLGKGGNKRFSDSVFITNSVPYIIYLEQGRTNQINREKGFMVQRTIAEVTENLQTEINKLL